MTCEGTSTQGIYQATIERISIVNGTPIGREMGMRTRVSVFCTNDRAFLDAAVVLIRVLGKGNFSDLAKSLRYALVKVWAVKLPAQ